MISDLPKDLREEILSRLPLKSMRSMRSACKKWNSLSETQSFFKMQLSKQSQAGEYQSVVIMEQTLYLLNVTVNEDISKEPTFKLVRLNQQASMKISQVFHCDGLLLCILEEGNRFVVWNPYLGQKRWIDPRCFYRGCKGAFMGSYVYALGYMINNNNKTCCLRSHKILRFLDDIVYPTTSEYGSRERFVWYEIYDFESGQWTTLDIRKPWYIHCYQRGVSLKGNTYWCATKNYDRGEINDHLICFDFTRERFGPLMLMPFIHGDSYNGHVTLSCVGEDKLAVLLTRIEENSHKLDIWITAKIETKKVDWIKFLTILDMSPEYPITTSGFFVDVERKIAVGFDEESKWDQHVLSIIVGEDGLHTRKLDLGERVDKRDRFSQLCCYVPSLVQINQLVVVGKRKRQNKTEQQKFDEKMKRLDKLDKRIV
ncbi:unnamed protein product [Cochlearia groenlandica]